MTITSTGPISIPALMKAMLLYQYGDMSTARDSLVLETAATPFPSGRDVLIKVRYCGVCHTELDEIEGRAAPARLPVIPGHQVVGEVLLEGDDCELHLLGQTVGVAWIHSSCGQCRYCVGGLENLCPEFCACGKDHDGGYAEYLVAPEAFVHPIPATLAPAKAAPLLCAGAVGYRSLRLAELTSGSVLGLSGFGSSNRLVLQMARVLHPGLPVQVYARSAVERELALRLGAVWAGDTEAAAPNTCTAIIDTTPVWQPVLASLRQLAPGGKLVINAIRKESSDQQLLTQLNYAEHLWMEKSIQSVANVSREDVRQALQLAAENSLEIEITEYPLEQANQALLAIRAGNIRTAAVLKIS